MGDIDNSFAASRSRTNDEDDVDDVNDESRPVPDALKLELDAGHNSCYARFYEIALLSELPF